MMVTKLLRALMVAATLCMGAVGAHAQAQNSLVRDDSGERKRSLAADAKKRIRRLLPRASRLLN